MKLQTRLSLVEIDAVPARLKALMDEERSVRRRNRQLFGVLRWKYHWFRLCDGLATWLYRNLKRNSR